MLDKKCAECGFLAMRNRFTDQLDEARPSYRKTGKAPFVRKPGMHGVVVQNPWEGDDFPWEVTPICFARAYDLVSEIQAAPNSGLITQEAILETTQKPRDACSEFIRWNQGFTPKEHREMLDRKYIMEREDRRDRELRESQERQGKSRLRWEIVIFGIIVTIALIAAEIIGAFIPVWFN